MRQIGLHAVLITCSILFFAIEAKSYEIVMKIDVTCPHSDDFTNFVKSLPEGDNHAQAFEEWKTSFVNNMQQLIHLVESGNIYECNWWVNIQEDSNSCLINPNECL